MTEEEKKEAARKRSKEHYEANKEAKKAYQKNNKEKITEDKKSYWKENKETLSVKKKIYNEANKEKINKRAKKYCKKKKEYTIDEKNKQREYQRLSHKKRMATDPLFKLKKNIRTAIGDSLNKKGFTKRNRSYEILGCSFEQFKSHLESKFETWMNWQNHGKYNGQLDFGWDIDHIIPLDNAETESDIINLNHYTNLQPLCSYTNRYIKRNK